MCLLPLLHSSDALTSETPENTPTQLYALFDVGGIPEQRQRQWRCYAANNTVENHTRYDRTGRCYCTRQAELAEVLCKCDPARCSGPPPPLPPPPPPPPLPYANETFVVFNSSISPPGARGPVTCYRVPGIIQTPRALVAFAEARIGRALPHGFDSTCDDCVVNGIAMRRSTDGGRTWGPYRWAVSDQSEFTAGMLMKLLPFHMGLYDFTSQ